MSVTPALSEPTRTLCARRFFSLLAECAGAVAAAETEEAGAALSRELDLLETVQVWWGEFVKCGAVTLRQPESMAEVWEALGEGGMSARGEALAHVDALRAARKSATEQTVRRQLGTLELLVQHLVLQLLV